MISLLRSLLTIPCLLALLAPGYFAFPSARNEATPQAAVVSAAFEGGDSWPAASPVTVTVKFDQNMLLASWQWVNDDSSAVVWQGDPLPTAELRPTGGAWQGTAPAPPQPGSYKVKVSGRVSGSNAQQEAVLALRGASLPDTQRPTRGFAFVRDGNIWLRGMDLKTERALTFYGRPGNAAMPAWSPDGRRIAYVRDIGTASSGYDLWIANADGTAARLIAKHTGDRQLGYPHFTPDGTLYVAESRPLTFGGVELDETWDLERVDAASGQRTPLLSGALMPDIAPDGKRVVYIQQSLNSDGAVSYDLVISDLDGSNERLLVPAGAANGLYAPAWSPDGKTIVFATQAMTAPSGRLPGLAMPSAHGGPWDLYTIPPTGGTPRLISPVQEDLPYPRWDPDGSRVLFISPTGLWEVPAAGGAAVLLAPNSAHSELDIFAPLPQKAAPLAGPSRCFAETNHCLRGIFLSYWDSHGGLAQFGFPIGDELIEEGRTVQYTQRARLEWHPEFKGTASEVLLGLLGANMADSRAAASEAPFQRQSAGGANSRYFAETGHNLQAPLRAYWESHGGLPVFGFPMSEAFQEKSATDGKTYLVQYFERNRLEYHPEFAGTASEVLLGLLGVQEYNRRYGE